MTKKEKWKRNTFFIRQKYRTISLKGFYMFNKSFFGNMNRAGFGSPISKTKLSNIMLEILPQLEFGTKNSKDNVIYNMGFTGEMSTTRDLNEAWTLAKKKAAKEYPDMFVLNARNTLDWYDDSKKELDKNISLVNYKKLNKLAEIENSNVNQIVSKLIKCFEKNK